MFHVKKEEMVLRLIDLVDGLSCYLIEYCRDVGWAQLEHP